MVLIECLPTQGIYSPYWPQGDDSRVFIGSKSQSPNLLSFMDSLCTMVPLTNDLFTLTLRQNLTNLPLQVRESQLVRGCLANTSVSEGGLLVESKASRPPTCFSDSQELVPLSEKSQTILLNRVPSSA